MNETIRLFFNPIALIVDVKHDAVLLSYLGTPC